MTNGKKQKEPRRPRVFELDDPALADEDDTWVEDGPTDAAGAKPRGDGSGFAMPSRAELAQGVHWGSLFVSAMVALAGLALGLWFTRFVSVAMAADGFLGWLATSLFVLLCVAGVAMIGREVIGVFQLQRLETLRKDADAALLNGDGGLERKVVTRVIQLYVARDDMKWQVAALREHQRDVRDPGDLLAIADRDLFAGLDGEARRIILASAKRVSVVTAISPLALIDVLFVFFENVRMLRALATIYGGRPGFLGALRLGRMVLTNLIAAGGIALTDDLLGQFIGQDLLRRLSRRLGEGAFNGALTARIGVAAVEITRPVPNIETTPVRVRDILSELFRRTREEVPAERA